MYRDTMLQNNNIELWELNKIIIGLGMNEKDVNNILMNRSGTKDVANLSIGPDPPYCSSYYGTISIEDF